MEVLILEALAAVFLLLTLLRPVFKGLWGLNGIVLLPIIALGLLAGIFPAYGFHPECIPLLLFAVFVNIINFGAFCSLFSKLQNDDFRDRQFLFTLICLALFGFTVWIVWQYSPPMDTELSAAETLVVKDRSRNEELWLRIYTPETSDPGPLAVFVPPVTGSIQVVDAVCAALRDKGFTVISYSRPGFDSPAFDEFGVTRRLFLPELYRLANALVQGLSTTTANEDGRFLEEGRKKDITFLLRELSENKNLRDKLPDGGIFLIGYGAGGAALAGLSASPEFDPRVKGIIAVESPILSSLTGEAPLPSDSSNPVFSIIRTLQNLVPRKITGIGIIPYPNVPALFIVSDKAPEEKSGRYATIFRIIQGSDNAILAALSGAGPFDYSDSPRLYPAISFLFRGTQTVEREPEAFPVITASLMANFAAVVMETEQDTAAKTSESETTEFDEVPPAAGIPAKTFLSGIYLEPGGGRNSSHNNLTERLVKIHDTF